MSNFAGFTVLAMLFLLKYFVEYHREKYRLAGRNCRGQWVSGRMVKAQRHP